MSNALRFAASVGYGGLVIAGGATIIPLQPILVVAGMAAGTIVLVSWMNNSRKTQIAKSQNKKGDTPIAKLQIKKGDDKFFIQSFSGDYCCAELSTDCRLTCNRKNVQEWESFQILKTDDGRFAFQSYNNQFVSVNRSQAGLLMANQHEINDSELFTMEERPDSFVAFKSSDGKFVSRREDANMSLKATATSVEKSELFRIMITKPVVDDNTINITKTISVKIDILNYKAIAKNTIKAQIKRLPVVGGFGEWAFGKIPEGLIPKSVKKRVNDEALKQIEELLKTLQQKAPKQIEELLETEGVKAKVSISII